MRLRWAHRARRDLLEIGRHIARDNPGVARRWVERIRDRARGAALTPHAGRLVPELGDPKLREVLLRSYRIIYRVESRSIVVLTVFEGHRQLRIDDVSEVE